ncbi:MAG: class I adenylate-forming enzyme family protein [Pseudomonadota bacterium]|jgi:long-chain acyl-CoA synthetase
MHYAELKAAWAELTGPGAPFELERKDIRGAPLLCYKNAPATIRDFWRSTLVYGERDYLVFGEERITYAEAHRIVASVANWILTHKFHKGERVAIAMRNYPEWMLVYWACASLGVPVVGMNAWWTAEEMAYAFNDSEPRVAFVDSERLARIRERPEMAANVQIVGVRTGDQPNVIPWAEVASHGGELPDATINPDDDACIFYTSGTTGFPKGAQLTHRGCMANLFNLVFCAQVQALATQRATGVLVDPAAPAPVPKGLVVTPLFHVTANNCAAYLITAAGGALVLMYKWDAGEALKLIEREQITALSGVPVMAREVITHPDFAKTDTSSLQSLGGGGAQLQPDLVAKIDQAVASARPNTGYGMTETCGVISSVSGDFFIDRPASAGPVLPTLEAKCVDDEGHAVAQGEIGELWVRGSPVIKGYLNRPEATAETITDGWLHTGDVARMDADGFIYIVDRKKDMVLRGGENIYCAEVEACLHRHPAVAECSVFGVPDARLGEEVGVALMLRPGHQATPAELREHCAANIAKHKTPRYIWISAEPLPRNANGKFLKRQLRDTLKLEDAV